MCITIVLKEERQTETEKETKTETEKQRKRSDQLKLLNPEERNRYTNLKS